jgi:hypothetical protein
MSHFCACRLKDDDSKADQVNKNTFARLDSKNLREIFKAIEQKTIATTRSIEKKRY